MLKPPTTIAARPSTAMPRKTPRKIGTSTVTLIACMARMPASGESRPSAGMMQNEKT
ncbi:hypothetical protein ACFFL2_09065 [Devosia nitrariae]|uniref:hypothetical protein n=1 Tax=Devosia nitrariae TaxID=2071872 RepID=UPI0032B010A5